MTIKCNAAVTDTTIEKLGFTEKITYQMVIRDEEEGLTEGVKLQRVKEYRERNKMILKAIERAYKDRVLSINSKLVGILIIWRYLR